MADLLADPVMLARIQFGANITFHILFPTISLGLCWVLLFFKLRHKRTGLAHWMEAYNFWVKVFALTFALGVVSGITMSFQFGTNWPGFMETVGNVAGPLLAYEVMTAFFLEATFLGIMLFGRSRVSDRTHTVATLLVAIGTSLSAFWILALNSWMQTPAGFEMRDGQAHVTDWLAMIFNPSLPYRLSHMLIASGLTVSFLVAGVSAYRWLRGQRDGSVLAALRTGLHLAALLAPLQILAGDLHGLNTLAHQPAKIAAIEGVWHTERGAPLLLFAIPDAERQENRHAIGIPRGAAWILTHRGDGELKGLDEFAGRHPPVAPVFWAFRVMVGIGLLMLATAWFGTWRVARRGEPTPRLARLLMLMTFAGWVGTVAGWFVTEIGRQPYLVQGLLTAREAASSVPSGMIGSTLAMYLVMYVLLIAAFVSVVFHLARKAEMPGSPETPSMPLAGQPSGAR